MTDPINGYLRNLPGNRSGAATTSKMESSDSGTKVGLSSAPSPGAASVPAHSVQGRDDTVDLSELARSTMSDPSFDRAKVESIKQAIKDGKYPLDSRRIAESFVALEKMIGE